jgi:predicted nucleic acid-binding protein
VHLVLDSSVLIAAVRPTESEHADARVFVERLRSAQAAGAARTFGPPELWLEVHVVEERLAQGRRGGQYVPGAAMEGLAIELVTPDRLETLTGFLDILGKRMRGRRPFANATDLAYLWAAHEVGATVVTLDQGMLAYHGVVCDVTRPQHIRLG